MSALSANLITANEMASEAYRLLGRVSKPDWHQAQAIAVQLTQAVQAMNRYIGCLEQTSETKER